MSKRILSVSYNERLLEARHKLLEQDGYHVSSALGFREATGTGKDGTFDLFILGHSIPQSDKEKIIRAFRATSDAPILSIWTHNERLADGVNYLAFSDAPDKLLANVAAILARRDSARASA
jgi:DNA-binding response OmpR family regulator